MTKYPATLGRNQIPLPVWTACLAVIGVACYIRWSTLTYESIWADETFSIELANQTWRAIVQGTAGDQHPPLYYFLLKSWTSLGVSIFHLRYLSTTFSILAVALTTAWGSRFLGLQAGLFAGLLLALAPLHVQWAQSIRMYSLMSLLSTLSCVLLYRFTRVRRGVLACAALNVLALYTHNIAIFLVGVQFVLVVFFSAKQKDWLLTKKWTLANFLLGLLYLPWVYVLYSQATQNTMTWAGPLTPETMVTLLTQITSGTAVSSHGLAVSSVWLGCLALLLLYGIWHAQSNREAAIYLVVWLSCALFSMFLTSQFLQFFVAKLLIWLLVPLLLLVGNGLQQLRGNWGKVMVAGFMVGSTASALFVQQIILDNQDCRGVAQLLSQESIPTDVVLFNAGPTSICVKAYGDMDYAFVTYPTSYSVLESGYQAVKVTPEFAEKTVASMQTEFRGIWLVEFWPHWFDPEGHLENELRHSAIPEREWQFRGCA